MATSRTALRPFLASMTCPPRRSRSYLGSAADTEPARARPRRPRSLEVFIGSATPRAAASRRPLAAQVFAHIQGSSHLVAGHIPGEGVADGIAALLAQEAADAHAVAV